MGWIKDAWVLKLLVEGSETEGYLEEDHLRIMQSQIDRVGISTKKSNWAAAAYRRKEREERTAGRLPEDSNHQIQFVPSHHKSTQHEYQQESTLPHCFFRFNHL